MVFRLYNISTNAHLIVSVAYLLNHLFCCSDQTGNIMEDIDLEDLSSNLSWEEDSVSSAQTWDQTPGPARPPPSTSATLTPVSTAAEEPQMDLEADFPIGKSFCCGQNTPFFFYYLPFIFHASLSFHVSESIERFRKQMQKKINSGKQRSLKRGHDGFPEKQVKKTKEELFLTTNQTLTQRFSTRIRPITNPNAAHHVECYSLVLYIIKKLLSVLLLVLVFTFI